MDEEPAEDQPERPKAPDAPAERVYICEQCGAVMEEIHCKITCKNCGYFRDCSDP